MLLSEADLKDRIGRGQVRAVISDASPMPKFENIANQCILVAVGDDVSGRSSYGQSSLTRAAFCAEGPANADDPRVLYFTPGTTSQPKMVLIPSLQLYPLRDNAFVSQ